MYRLVVFDMDGVLFLGETVIPAAPRAVERLRRKKVTIRYLTNNSTQTREFYVRKLAGFGILAEPHEIVTSASATANYMARHTSIKTVFVVGGPGLRDETIQVGIVAVTPDMPSSQDLLCDGVVAGLDKNFTYETLLRAQQVILRTGVLIATNRDTQYPTETGVIPGGGSIVAAIAAASEVEPLTIGKPEPTGLQFLMDSVGVDTSHTLMVGDRLDTDIACANRAGADSACVLTGVTSARQCESAAGECKPTFVFVSLDELMVD